MSFEPITVSYLTVFPCGLESCFRSSYQEGQFRTLLTGFKTGCWKAGDFSRTLPVRRRGRKKKPTYHVNLSIWTIWNKFSILKTENQLYITFIAKVLIKASFQRAHCILYCLRKKWLQLLLFIYATRRHLVTCVFD